MRSIFKFERKKERERKQQIIGHFQFLPLSVICQYDDDGAGGLIGMDIFEKQTRNRLFPFKFMFVISFQKSSSAAFFLVSLFLYYFLVYFLIVFKWSRVEKSFG
jgi:hypothetical protein